MSFLFARFLFSVLLPLLAVFVAVMALSAARRRLTPDSRDQRLAALEEQVRGLLYRVWTLEQRAPPSSDAPPVGPAPAPTMGPPVVPAPSLPIPSLAAPADPQIPLPLLTSGRVEAEPLPAGGFGSAAPPPGATPNEPGPPRIDLEQRIGARWATWVGVVAILFAIGFFLKWSFENDWLGPERRVTLGLVAGLGLLIGGLLLHPRRNVPHLSEGLAGLGLGVLYLSLYGAHVVYELVGPLVAFAAMFAVTLLGALVAVVSSRQITAMLTVLGGLFTPMLLTVEQPDERNLLIYLLVLDLLVLAVAWFRTWPVLGRLAWAGTALLFGPILVREPDSPHPLSRLALLSAIFVLFLAVPLVRPLAHRRRHAELDLLLVVANAAGYSWVVYTTLEGWRPGAEGWYAVGMAVVYRLISSDYAHRVPDDDATVVVHEGVAWVFLTLAIPLALDGPWMTVAWAGEGVALLWAAARAETPVAAWGGLAALLLAAARAVAWDLHAPGEVPVWNLGYLVHLLVVVALVWGGAVAPRARPARLRALTGAAIRKVLWLAAALVLAALFWQEPSGLWPASLLTAELVVVGWLARVVGSAWAVATPIVALVLLARVLGADDLQARIAAESLLNAPLVSRIAACIAMTVAGSQLARSTASVRAPVWGRWLSGAAGVVLLVVLSVDWTRYQGRGDGWTTQVGLSLLWTLYAALALGWGFVRSRPPVRYAALALLGFTVLKVFLVDLAAVRTVYRILSFLVLGVVLLGVSLLYQKGRRETG
ncbi:MAG TPA: DUF2339 domain-containing protein [Candidatus Methylomirabilis sp.]|nr:DUF2339 domain-containing protein [Candidatus Methylomirabilis sp.]